MSFNASAYLVDRRVDAGDGERVALRCDGVDLTYKQLRDRSALVAAAFAALGVRREERVLFVMADGLELAAGILGAMRGGMVAVPVNTMLTAADLGLLLADSRARLVVCSSEFAEPARSEEHTSELQSHVNLVC